MTARTRGRAITRRVLGPAWCALGLAAQLVHAIATATERPGSRAPAGRPCALDEEGSTYADLGLVGRLGSVAALPHENALWIVARVLSPTAATARRFGTRVVLARVRRDGTFAYGPRVIAQESGSVDGALALSLARDAAEGAVPAVWLARGLTAVRVTPSPSSAPPGTDATLVLRAPVRGVRAAPLFAVDAPGDADGTVSLVWRRSEHAWVQRASTLEAPEAPVHYATPARTIVVDAARAHGEGLLFVARTSARRYVIAHATREGRLRWTGLAPEGCARGRCAPVSLVPSREGVLAHWRARLRPEPLYVAGARSLSDDGHARAPGREFVPMVNPAPLAGPQGEPLAVQLGHPSVLRGTRRPVELRTLAGAPRAEVRAQFPRPTRALSYATSPRALAVLLLAPGGALAWHRLACDE